MREKTGLDYLNGYKFYVVKTGYSFDDFHSLIKARDIIEASRIYNKQIDKQTTGDNNGEVIEIGRKLALGTYVDNYYSNRHWMAEKTLDDYLEELFVEGSRLVL